MRTNFVSMAENWLGRCQSSVPHLGHIQLLRCPCHSSLRGTREVGNVLLSDVAEQLEQRPKVPALRLLMCLL